MGKGPLEEAMDWLKLTRERFDLCNMESHIGYIREYADKAGVSLVFIGTSEEELKEMMRRGHFAESKTWLSRARQHPDQYEADTAIRYFLKYLVAAGLTIADTDTTIEELQDLSLRGHKAEAKKWLKSARETRDKIYGDHTKYVRNHLSLSGGSPEDIGTSDEELDRLSQSRVSAHP